MSQKLLLGGSTTEEVPADAVTKRTSKRTKQETLRKSGFGQRARMSTQKRDSNSTAATTQDISDPSMEREHSGGAASLQRDSEHNTTPSSSSPANRTKKNYGIKKWFVTKSAS